MLRKERKFHLVLGGEDLLDDPYRVAYRLMEAIKVERGVKKATLSGEGIDMDRLSGLATQVNEILTDRFITVEAIQEMVEPFRVWENNVPVKLEFATKKDGDVLIGMITLTGDYPEGSEGDPVAKHIYAQAQEFVNREGIDALLWNLSGFGYVYGNDLELYPRGFGMEESKIRFIVPPDQVTALSSVIHDDQITGSVEEALRFFGGWA